jgi:dynein heavy chain
MLQAYSKPPTLVDLTLSGVMTVLKRPGSWEEAKKQLGDANFMSKLLNYDKVCFSDLLIPRLATTLAKLQIVP